MPIRDFRDLDVWNKAVDIAEAVYIRTAQWPGDERFGMTAQVRSAAVSVSSNIAEGNGRGSTKDYIRFLRMAKGSLNEIRSLLLVSIRLKFATKDELLSLETMIDEASRMLVGLIKSLSRRARKKRGAVRRRR